LADHQTRKRGLDRPLQIRVVENDAGALSAELERDPFHPVGCHLHDLLSGHGLAGEGNLVHARVRREKLAGRRLAESSDDVHDSGRNARFLENLSQDQRGEWGPLGRLEHDRVAKGQCRSDLPGSHYQRKVPGDDLGAHSYRFTQGIGKEGFGNRDRLTEHLVRKPCIVLETIDRERNIQIGALEDGLSVVARL
jgi:hypothetical protein